MVLNALHPENIASPNPVTVVGMFIDVSPLQFLNALFPTLTMSVEVVTILIVLNMLFGMVYPVLYNAFAGILTSDVVFVIVKVLQFGKLAATSDILFIFMSTFGRIEASIVTEVAEEATNAVNNIGMDAS